LFLDKNDDHDERDKKSVLRSIRVSRKLATNLEREARERRISLNSLVASVLEKHDEWEVMAEKFGFVHISGELFGQLLTAIDDRDIARIAGDSGRSISTDLITFWFKEINLDSVLRYMSMLAHYQRLFTLESVELHGRLVIIAHHAFGEKGSIWFMNFLCAAIKANLNVAPTARKTKTSVRIEIPLSEIETVDTAVEMVRRRILD
jgi:hypothetical protein